MKSSDRTTEKISIEELTINTIRTLSMDAVQKANSGHPGTPMALAPLAYVLWKRFLKFNPGNPQWFNRDRFVLSNGHASMLLYSMLYLTGYDISLDDIKNFRQWDSKTPGHPEYGCTPGVETTTGPLGQGIMNSVGMAIAEAHLAAHFNREEHEIVNHYTYAFCSDGDFMEGASNEAASIAGHLKLGKLIWFYDNNHISIEGNTKISYSDNVAQRFKGYHWHVQDIGDKANDIDAITEAIEKARTETDKPSLIIIRSHIGYGAPDKQDTPEAHGSPLGEDEVRATKEFYEWPSNETFYVPDDVLDHMRAAIQIGDAEENTWEVLMEDYQKKFPELAKEFNNYLKRELPEGWDEGIPHFTPDDGPIATRKASSKIINGFASKIPWIIGGSGDLAPSTNTLIEDSEYIEAGDYDNRNIAWGVREHAMCAASSGIYLHGGLRPFAATFFIFTDYARPAIRLAALMRLPVIYVLTHDSIGLGEDGPTHQPVEQIASFRAMPDMCVIRPADANETAYAWRVALKRQTGPTMLILTRQKLPVFDGRKVGSSEGVTRGAYIISKEKGDKPDVILIGSGSEVSLLLNSKEKLVDENIDARIVSMPSWELFKEQKKEYREEILPPGITKRLAVEAAASFGWCEWVGNEGAVIGVDKFGASAPSKDIFEHYGFTVD
ncbi:MAG TPA: transketolase, partial [Ignavibacteriaceae bacterium]|nr:transketolase [Ignavibacteriaceae bacterium]